ncbi:MAG TPA: hypothetical protein VN181_05310, partial [Thermoanaerobaculia bacterium]|nr:hypothetical protein [Thermoanaerobaculia bacterium]
KVRAVTSNLESVDSGVDLATTVIFTDEPLVAPSTPFKAVHLTEMRSAVNAVRALGSATTGGGLPPATWTDPSPAGVRVRAAHITELRTALDAARNLLMLSPVAYTNATSGGVIPVHAIDFMEIRNGTK